MKIRAEEIIVSHPAADFDSLASMVAASKLYPNAKMVLIGGMDIGVREFYSLYRIKFPLYRLKQIDTSTVQRMIITDTSRLSRLKPVADLLADENIEVHLYDHHAADEGEIRADFAHCQQYGSTTTILVMELVKRGITLSAEEATLMMLGLYEDTGNLTFSSTTPQDFDAAKYLHTSGANLELVRRYISHELSAQQKDLMQKLTINTRDMLINGVRIHFASAKIAAFVDEIAFITSKIQELENADCLFTVVEVKDRAYIIGRSRIATVNIAHILGHFGGGGHPSAGSALVPDIDHEKALSDLIKVLREELKPNVVARDIMATPVHSVLPETTIEDARNELIKLGHSGLIVSDADGKMHGLLSRRDVDKAIMSGRGPDAVREHMASDVLTADENAGLHELEKLIVRHNVGRIPIVDGEKAIGIVTRSDIVRSLHRLKPVGDEEGTELPLQGSIGQEDVFKGLPRHLMDILIRAGHVADRVKMPVFLVGGFVRDIILERPSEDIDLVVEGDAIMFAEALGIALELRVDANHRFGTAKVHLGASGGIIDIAGSRKEIYESPGALPTVSPGTIDDDTIRRDFTINTVAIRINHSTFGEMLDPFNGREDIRAGLIRVLHDKSFVDDPTRIFRAVRFASRFGFAFESSTRALMNEALRTGAIATISMQRVREELWLLLNEMDPLPCLIMLNDLGIMAHVHKKLTLPKIFRADKDPVKPLLEEYGLIGLPYHLNPQQIYFCLLAWEFNLEDIENFSGDFQLSGDDEKRLTMLPGLLKNIPGLYKSGSVPRPSAIYKLLDRYPVELLIAYLANGDDRDVKGFIRIFLQDLKQVKLEISGEDLKGLGYPPSPAYKKVLQAVFNAKLDGIIHGREDEIQMADTLLREEHGEPEDII